MSTTPECRVRTKQWKPLLERFWENVRKSDGCWLWMGNTKGNGIGYGQIIGNGAKIRAHRLSYIIHRGPIPNGMHVCHRCDTPACVNPGHLFLGTDEDNRQDCVSKCRHARGETHGMAKLTERKVSEIRRRWAGGGISQLKIAKEYGVHHSVISDVVNYTIWKHVS